jgi:hypothetical protein
MDNGTSTWQCPRCRRTWYRVLGGITDRYTAEGYEGCLWWPVHRAAEKRGCPACLGSSWAPPRAARTVRDRITGQLIDGGIYGPMTLCVGDDEPLWGREIVPAEYVRPRQRPSWAVAAQ